MNRKRNLGLLLLLGVASVFLVVFIPDVVSTTDTTAAATNVRQTSTETTASNQTTAEPTCLVEPVAEGLRGSAGEVTTRISAYGEVDCHEVFGGEPIAEQSVMATDSQGVIDFSLDVGDGNCSLRQGSQIQVVPDNDVAISVADGDVICTFTSDDEEIVVEAGQTRSLPLVRGETTVSITREGDLARFAVLQGFVAVDPPGMACRTIVGPFQRAEITLNELPSVHQLDAASVRNIWRGVLNVSDESLDVARQNVELLPGLTDLIDQQDVTVLIDGQLIGSGSTLSDSTDTLEMITGSELQIIDPGEIRVLEPTRFGDTTQLEQLPDVTIAEDLLTIETFDRSTLIDPDRLSQVLEGVTTVEPTIIDIFIDPEGRKWSLAYNSSNVSLREQLEETMTAQLQSGSFGVVYFDIFEETPDYGLLLPNLLGGRDVCEDTR